MRNVTTNKAIPQLVFLVVNHSVYDAVIMALPLRQFTGFI